MKHFFAVHTVAFSSDGSQIMTAARGTIPSFWDAGTGDFIGELMVKDDSFFESVVYSPDGRLMATGLSGGKARFWDPHTGAPMGEPMKHDGEVSSVVFSPDGSRIATASHDKRVRLWDAHTILPKNMMSFLNRFTEKPDPTISRDFEFEEELKTFLARKQFLYRSSTAVQSVAKKSWFAAKFHLPWLCEQEPDNPRWKKLLEETNAASSVPDK